MTKRNELSNHKNIRRKVKRILLSERSLLMRLHSMWSQPQHSGKGKTTETGKRPVAARVRR
jgi:hypothetical protein